MEHSKRAARRRHGSDLKTKVLAACAEPGASVANVALAHGLNTNLVHKWRRHAEGRVAVVPAAMRQAETFIPMSLSPASASGPCDIRIELRRGATAVKLNWPVGASAQCAGWLRELLR